MNRAQGNIAPRFEQLFGLQREPRSLKHLETVAAKFALIPYENLTKIIRSAGETDPVRRLRMPEDILQGFAEMGAGGTCFSLTFCMVSLLREYGYNCGPRMADLGRSSNNHCALVVTCDDREYLLDPGYLIIRPLPLPAAGAVVHETRLYPVRIERNRFTADYTLSTLEPDGPRHRYLLRDSNCDMEMFRMFWIDSFQWTMMRSLLVTRFIEDGRFYMHDRYARWMNRHGRKTGKLRENYDLEVSRYTGISRDLVSRARLILAAEKPGLRQETD